MIQFVSYIKVVMVFKLHYFCIFIYWNECREQLLLFVCVCRYVWKLYCYHFCECWEAIMLH